MRIEWGSERDDPALNAAVGAYVAATLFGDERGFQNYTSMAVFDRHGAFMAGLIYHNFERRAGIIEISGASESRRWLPKPVAFAMHSYPFDQLGCQMIVMRVSEHNAHLASILRRYGYDSVRIPRLRGRDEAEDIFTLTDDAWRSNGFHKE